MAAEKEERKLIPIALAEFLNGMTAPADLYIKLVSGKAILIFKSGTKFDQERLKKYLDKNITHLWVYSEDFEAFCDAAVGIASAGISSGLLSTSKKIFLVSNASKSIYRNFEEVGLDLSGYELAEKTSRVALEISKTDINIQTLVSMLYDADNYLTSHSVATAILAPAIGQEMGLESAKSLEKLAMGGFFHDIGKLQIPPELLAKPVSQMTHADLHEYRQHCLLGAEMMKSLSLNSEDLTAIIYQHHERNDGSGYPQKLSAHKIHPLAKVVGMASEFLNLVMPNPRFNSISYSPEEALKLVGGGMGMPFDKMNHRALQNVVERSEPASDGEEDVA